MHKAEPFQGLPIPVRHTFGGLCDQGPMFSFLKYLRRKIWAKVLAIFAQTTASFYNSLIILLVFEKNANIFRRKLEKNRRKL
jgi:hypothetical protein